MKIKYLNFQELNDKVAFNQYLLKSKSLTITDTVEWGEIVREVYNIEPFYIIALENNLVVGTLSLFFVKHPIFRKYLITAPFATEGGLYFDNDEVKKLLVEEALTLSEKLNVDYVLLRTRENILEYDKRFKIDCSYVTFELNLNRDINEIWRSFDHAARKNIKKALSYGFVIKRDKDNLRKYFEVLNIKMKELGSPFHSFKFYEKIAIKIRDYFVVILIEWNNKTIGGSLLLRYKDCLHNLLTGTLDKYSWMQPNSLLFYETIKIGKEQNCSCLDMGRSKINSGTYKFKAKWGATPIRLYYNYYLRKLKNIPDLHPTNPKYRLCISVWKKMPSFITNLIGPWLIRGIL